MEAAALLCADVCCVLDSDLVALGYAVCTLECKGAYGPVIFDHLAADGAGFPGSQVTVVTIGQVNTDFLSSLHLELVHSFLSLGNIDPVVIGIAHLDSLLFVDSGKQDAFRIGEHHFLSVTIVLPKLR